jgi:hypothetical protein
VSPPGLVREGLQDQYLEQAPGSPVVLCGREQPIEWAESGLERPVVPIAAVPHERQPREPRKAVHDTATAVNLVDRKFTRGRSKSAVGTGFILTL